MQAGFRGGDARFEIDLPDLDGFEHIAETVVNRETLLRVNKKLGNEFRKGDSEWPEETQFSRKHFRGDLKGIYNPAYYAVFVEAREDPSTHPPQPAGSYVRERFPVLLEEELNAEIKRDGRQNL